MTDEQKLENLISRSSSVTDELEKTIKIDRINSLTDTLDRIHIVQVDSVEDIDCDNNDNDIEEFRVVRRTPSNTFRHQAIPVTNTSSLNIPELLKHEYPHVRSCWTNISDKNIEHERDELVLYVQNNSRVTFAGVIQQSLLNDEYLKKLVRILFSIIDEPQVSHTFNCIRLLLKDLDRNSFKLDIRRKLK